MKNQRYTENQKLLLKFDPTKLTEHERQIVRRSTLPRKCYQPETDEEAEDLALQYLGEREYARFQQVRADIFSRYDAQGRWGTGDTYWKLYYRFYINGKALCGIAIQMDVFELEIGFGKREQDLFEQQRDTFSRGGIQWTYDMFYSKNGRKAMRFDLREQEYYEEVFRLLAIRCKPNR